VTDKEWLRHSVDIFGYLIPGEIKGFRQMKKPTPGPGSSADLDADLDKAMQAGPSAGSADWAPEAQAPPRTIGDRR
jgi:hypothetical protein